MGTSKAYKQFILEQLSGLEVTARSMMGEYLLYYQGKLFGGLCDDRLLVKITDSARAMMPDAVPELPYEGGKPMLSVSRLEDRAFLAALIPAIAAELPEPKPKKAKRQKKPTIQEP